MHTPTVPKAASKTSRARAHRGLPTTLPNPSDRWTDAIRDLFDEAQAQFKQDGCVDDVWIDGAASLTIQVILSAQTETLADMEKAFSLVDSQILAASDLASVSHTDIRQRDTALAQLSLLRRLSQLGSDAVAPREIAARIEPDTHASRLLFMLADTEDEVFSDVIVEELEIHPTQLSQLYKRLGPEVLERRKYGRRVSWTLSSTGEAVAAQLRDRAFSPAPELLETAASPEEFEDAVHREVDAIEIDRPVGGDGWYVRATYSRLSGNELFGHEPLPYVVFPTSSDDAAYLRGDFARKLIDYVHSHPSETSSAGLTLSGKLSKTGTKIDRAQIDTSIESKKVIDTI
ncbi:hypothetical protein [Pengzhenrongella sicca]|uniref:Uncharacterized protein n=1 Tax=Pengzhenrongella sicca TaxID=2819238 RepID=A0A8A4ZF61_9MICO|nr:hypothetical protein [Pengzhenrongella sicca]QTE30051.1 hypothetical protein J4E96_03230 [Pengzhenrongella sicca]